MKHGILWPVAMLVIGACHIRGQAAPTAGRPASAEPATVARSEGTNLARVILRPEAATRLDIRTTPVREDSVPRMRKFAGEVVSISSDQKKAFVQVSFTESDVKDVRREGPGFVLPLARDAKAFRAEARVPGQSSPYALSGPFGTAYYEVDNTALGLAQHEFVFLELPFAGGADKLKIVPYAALIYDARGAAWVYTNPSPFVFVRHPVAIVAIAGSEAILGNGPAVGTAVVTVGAAELYGTEFGVGK